MKDKKKIISKFMGRLKDKPERFEDRGSSFFVVGQKMNYDFRFAENRVLIHTKDEDPKVFEVAEAFKK